MHWRDPSYAYQDMDDLDYPVHFLLFVKVCHLVSAVFFFVVFCLFADHSMAAGSEYKLTSASKSHSSITTDINGNYLPTIQNN